MVPERYSGGESACGVRLWNLKTGELIVKLSGHSDWVQSVAFSPDGLTLASGGDDQTIKIWRIEFTQVSH